MNQFKDKLNDILENGYFIAPFQVMSEAFTYYRKTFMLTLVTLLLAITALMLIGSTVVTQFIDVHPNSTPEEAQELMLAFTNKLLEPPYLYYYLAVFAVISALSGVLIAGYYKINAEASLGNTPKFTSVFKYFFSIKGLYIFIAQLLISTLFIGITIPLQMEKLELVSLAINWLINTLMIFTIPLIIFGNLNPFSAIKTSITIVNKQPIPIILTVVLNYFFLMSGLLFFVVGILFVLPYLFSVYFTLYKHAINYNIE